MANGDDVLSGKEAFDALALMAALGSTGTQAPLHSLLDQNPDLLRRLERVDPIHAAATFADLLTAPQLQANCYRIEALVHLALALGRGKQKASDKLLARAFRELGTGLCGLMEDPSEDMFVTAVRCDAGNFLVLEGPVGGLGLLPSEISRRSRNDAARGRVR